MAEAEEAHRVATAKARLELAEIEAELQEAKSQNSGGSHRSRSDHERATNSSLKWPTEDD